jgi:menaquinone-9 beta-reductase
MSYDTDVLIIGGGPAGLSTAIAGRQHGLRALVVDIAEPPIDKACGEGLMPDSLETLAELGVTLAGIETGEFHGVRFIGPGASVAARFPTGVGLGIRRTLLHEELIRRAEAVGAILLWGMQVEIESGAVTLHRTTPLKPKEGLNGARETVEVRYRWLVGADGHDSRVRRFAGLNAESAYERRIGLRRHFRVKPWSEFVEIYWGENCEAYVTPIASDQVCVALIARRRASSFEDVIAQFPDLAARLSGASVYTSVRGSLTVTRRLPSVTNGNVALVGEASGSTDAITGEGLGVCFRQALALGRALAEEDLCSYEREHRKIMRLPQFMGRMMLLMDKSRWIRTRTVRALEAKPLIFGRMLSVHVGAIPLAEFGIDTTVMFGWEMLTS